MAHRPKPNSMLPKQRKANPAGEQVRANKTEQGLLSQGEFRARITGHSPTIHREDIIVTSIFAPNNMAATFVKQMLREMQREPEEAALTQFCLAGVIAGQ